MKQGIPRIREFPADDRFWRVDWYGAVLRNPNVPSEPYIQIVISPLVDPALINKSPKHLASVKSVTNDDRQTIRVGIGQLPLIKIGSLWKNGLCQSPVAGTEYTFRNLNISPDSLQVISATHEVNGERLIPYHYYRFGGAGLNSKLIAINWEGDPLGILIPAVELIRFYYAVSSDMAHAVFSGHFKHDLNAIINSDKSGLIKEQERCVIACRQHLSDEVWDDIKVSSHTIKIH